MGESAIDSISTNGGGHQDRQEWIRTNDFPPEGKAYCIWFDPDTKGCSHYEHRPMICREFEVGGEDCLRIRGKAGR